MISICTTIRSALAGIALAAMSASGAQAATADVVLTIEEISGSQTLFKAEGALDLTTLGGQLAFPALSTAFSSPTGGASGLARPARPSSSSKAPSTFPQSVPMARVATSSPRP